MIRACLATVAAAAIALPAAGCGGSQATNAATGAETAIPSAARAHAAPNGYRISHAWRADLSGGRVADVVVSSVGPPIKALAGIHGKSMDLRVLTWSRGAKRWHVAFDAQKVPTPNTSCGGPASSQGAPECLASDGSEYLGVENPPLLDPQADVSLGPVRFAHILSRHRDQLVFSAADDYGGSGAPMVLTVVDLVDGPSLEYSWTGQDLLGWHVAHGRLYGRAMYWTPDDPHCCPLRSYRFTVAHRGDEFLETSDSRPWLGVTARGERSGLNPGPLQVVGIAPYSPARNALRIGDRLVKVLDAPRPHHGNEPWNGFFDQLDLLHPGQVARLLVERNGAKIVVSVRLGSLKDSIPSVLPIGTRLVAL